MPIRFGACGHAGSAADLEHGQAAELDFFIDTSAADLIARTNLRDAESYLLGHFTSFIAAVRETIPRISANVSERKNEA